MRMTITGTPVSDPAGFVGRKRELSVLHERLGIARTGRPQVVFVEAEPGAGKSTLLSQFVGSITEAVILQASGDEAETLLSYGVVDQLGVAVPSEPGADPMAVGARLVELLDRLQSHGQVVVMVMDYLQWVDRPSSRAVLFALRRLRRDTVLAIVARGCQLAEPGHRQRRRQKHDGPRHGMKCSF
jgi:ABC-type ATPase involved in cell division